jgi:hypothetical protein
MPILDTSEFNWGGGDGGGGDELIPPGTRCTVRLIRTNMGVNVNKHPYLMLAFEAPEYPNSDEFVDFLNFLTGESMTIRERRRERNKWQDMAKCFNVYLPESGQVDLRDWEGKEGFIQIGVRKHKGKDVNCVDEYIVPE